MSLTRPMRLDSLALPIPVPLELTFRAVSDASWGFCDSPCLELWLLPALRRRALYRLATPLPLGLYKGRACSVLLWDLDVLILVDISRWPFLLAAGWVTLVGALV